MSAECECGFCKWSSKLKVIIGKLHDVQDREFLNELAGHICDIGSDLEYHQMKRAEDKTELETLSKANETLAEEYHKSQTRVRELESEPFIDMKMLKAADFKVKFLEDKISELKSEVKRKDEELGQAIYHLGDMITYTSHKLWEPYHTKKQAAIDFVNKHTALKGGRKMSEVEELDKQILAEKDETKLAELLERRLPELYPNADVVAGIILSRESDLKSKLEKAREALETIHGGNVKLPDYDWDDWHGSDAKSEVVVAYGLFAWKTLAELGEKEKP